MAADSADVFEFAELRAEVNNIVTTIISRVLEGQKYSLGRVSDWNDEITSSSIKQLKELCSNFKYVVTCVILEKTGAGFHMSTTSYWDKTTDGIVAARWDNSHLACMVTVFGLAL
eukprot:PLAT5710.1.p1 GENE.PLAT5710.1~~PLAT5710.1.p1  ORF type:complete len:115 (-),score=38.50 PLAT5710.1:93-437(-)